MTTDIKVLLINSYIQRRDTKSTLVGISIEEPHPPIGLLYLQSYLLSNGVNVVLLDLPVELKRNGVEWDESKKCVRLWVSHYMEVFQPDVVGIGCLFSGKFCGAVHVSEIVKEIDPKCQVVIGGVHPTVFAKEIIKKVPTIDVIFLGESEISFYNGLIGKPCYGQVFRDFQFKTIHTVPQDKYTQNLDEPPYPAWDRVDLDDYAIDDWSGWHNPKKLDLKYRMPILTSRSCPINCSFCSVRLMMGNKTRFRSVEHCMQEIKYLYYEKGVNYFSIIDDNFILDKDRVMRFAEEIASENLDIYIDTPSGICMRFFDKDILDALKTMGLLRLSFPIESGSDYIRETIIKKKLPREKIYECSELVRNEKDILVRAFLVLGMPQETHETMQVTLDMVKELYIDDVTVHLATPFPGTPLYDEVIANDLLIAPLDDVLYMDNFHLCADTPLIKPYKLHPDELVVFKHKVEFLFTLRRKELGVKKNRSIKHLMYELSQSGIRGGVAGKKLRQQI